MFSLYVVNKHGSLLYQNDIGVPRQGVTTNDKIRWASTFHALSSMAAQISPVSGGRAVQGIEMVGFGEFNLFCKHTLTGLQFILIASSGVSKRAAEDVLRAVYQVYADYALKNPFYAVDMPIRLTGFNRGIRQVIHQHSSSMN